MRTLAKIHILLIRSEQRKKMSLINCFHLAEMFTEPPVADGWGGSSEAVLLLHIVIDFGGESFTTSGSNPETLVRTRKTLPEEETTIPSLECQLQQSSWSWERHLPNSEFMTLIGRECTPFSTLWILLLDIIIMTFPGNESSWKRHGSIHRGQLVFYC